MKTNEVFKPIWQFTALTYGPDIKVRQGEVKAHTLKDALRLVHGQNLFAISVKLKDLESGTFALNMAVIQAVINKLKKEGVETQLTEAGKLVVMISETKNRKPKP